MVVYPDLAFLLGLALHGGNWYLFRKLHSFWRPRWQRFSFLFYSSLLDALFVIPQVPAFLSFFLYLMGFSLFFRGRTLRGTLRNILIYLILGGIRFALTWFVCAAFSCLSLVFLSEGVYFRVSFLCGIFGAVASFIVLRLFLRFRVCKGIGTRIVNCTVVLDGISADFRCYADSGNFLTDPIRGCPVAILEYSALRRAFGQGFPEPLSYPFADRFGARARVIPLRGVSGTGEMLSAFVPDGFFVDGKSREVTIAVTPCCLDGCGRFCGIIGLSLSEGD